MRARLRLGDAGPSPDPRLEGEDAARTVRGMLGLGDEPAVALDDRLEAEAGLRIFHLDGLPSSLCAVLLWSEELGACVALNASHSLERRRWSLAHELGHFLRDREAGDVLEATTRPAAAAEAFAKEFLLPAAGVRKRFAERCRAGKFTPVDIRAMARAFGVSFGTMTLRLEELRLLPRNTYDKLEQSSLCAEETMVRYDPTARNHGGRSSAEGRGKLAADDRKVRRVASELLRGLELVSTLDLVHEATRVLGWDDGQLAAVAAAMRWRGNFAPPRQDPRAAWYAGLLRGEGLDA